MGKLAAVMMVALVAALSVTTAVAGTPTVTPEPTSTVVPGSSSITIRFVSGGRPTRLYARAALDFITADGSLCAIPITDTAELVGHMTFVWPLTPEVGQPLACTKHEPTQLLVHILTQGGDVKVSLAWTGLDIVHDEDVSSGSPSPAITASVLPSTGGPVKGEGSNPTSTLSVTVLGIVALGFPFLRRARR